MKLKMILALTIVCFVSALLLAKVYQLTDSKIKKDITETGISSLLDASFPGMKEYKDIPRKPGFYGIYDGAGKTIGIARFTEKLTDTVWNIVDTAGITGGIICRVFPNGYNGPFEMFVAIAMDSSVIGISFSENLKETPGLGTKIKDLWFKSQFIGKKPGEVLLSSEGGKIDAITGATVSSNAVITGVKEAIEKYSYFLTKN